ncbi:hypothetical protein MJD09_18350 [bacterium]|nr:hypothetical protein [bacterium]
MKITISLTSMALIGLIFGMTMRKVDGLLFSFEHRIVLGDKPDNWPQLHHMKYDSIKLYETADEQFFFPRPDLRLS